MTRSTPHSLLRQTSPWRRVALLAMPILFAGMACNLSAVVHPDPAGPIDASPTVTEVLALSQTPVASEAPTAEPSPTPTTCGEHPREVVMLIQPALSPPLEAELARFQRDLCAEGFRTLIEPSGFDGPEEIRLFLRERFAQTEGRLTGALLVGDIPYAYQYVKITYENPDIPPRIRYGISTQYYSDLNGRFETSEGFTPPEGKEPMFDLHQGETDWEIWVSLLPTFHADLDQTVEALRRYFALNHAFRTQSSELPRTLLQIHEQGVGTLEEHERLMRTCTSGNLNWTAISTSPEPLIFFDSPAAGLSVKQGYEALAQGVADFTVLLGHGHEGAVGQVSTQWLQENPLRTHFFWSNGCDVGNLDNPHVILNSILYDPKSMVLVATGNTMEGMGLGTNEEGSYATNIAGALAGGATLGDAVLGHVNVPLVPQDSWWPEAVFAPRIFLGDLTLRLHK